MNVMGFRDTAVKFFQYLRDPSVGLWRKLAGLFAVLYLVSPVDALPDFIPLIGWLDDVGVLFFVANLLLKDVQRYVPAPVTVKRRPDEPTLRRLR